MLYAYITCQMLYMLCEQYNFHASEQRTSQLLCAISKFQHLAGWQNILTELKKQGSHFWAESEESRRLSGMGHHTFID